ncbi:PhzF family phenazine biosynthesis protein [Roseicitreum antarcticum]|uniref:Trans-2,3-dihydro-3-hydroxyanthranilate isomerase n=1 Tax=Roseicitreum antarcticum TaxID=564137 RepID=A0A1H2RMU1_9RHOB|nr:PhzF family phenazine biosynthesis protein [Roseicitreum antarcticum]SDW19949.1 trans-2,3-dihydro-3-hydroxyanthranilate isomerase [Roseicitreum antarcticum]
MLELITYDVFTDTPFLGNPLAIVPQAEGLTTSQMQTIARELNLSETIFVMRPDNAANKAKVRIFFPKAEIPFAGHPTIGCAIYLSGLAGTTRDSTVEMTLEENAGPVPVIVRMTNGRVSAEFTAPLLPERTCQIDDIALTARALGLEPGDIGSPILKAPEVWQAGPSYLLVPVATRAALGRARPTGADWEKLTEHAGTISAWLFVADSDHQFRARMFSPAGGTPEDPATGSAVVTFVGLLARHGYYNARLDPRIQVTQGVEMGRRSEIQARAVMHDDALAAVRIGGSAVQISTGRIRIP